MPVCVLDSIGEGDVPVIARGVRYAARRGADVIDLSLESPRGHRRRHPQLLSAIGYTRSRGAVVVGASGNEGHATVAYPARAGDVLAVGATTERGCLSDFSNEGRGLDIVAPGGGRDAVTPVGEPGCDSALPGRPIVQLTYTSGLGVFGYPDSYEGTSMAAPHVAAAAALVIASGVVGPHRPRGGREAPRGDRARSRHAGLRRALRLGPDQRGRGHGPCDRLDPDDQHRAGRVVGDLVRDEPRRNLSAPVMPLLPTTIRSARRSSATSSSAAAGSPWRA